VKAFANSRHPGGRKANTRECDCSLALCLYHFAHVESHSTRHVGRVLDSRGGSQQRLPGPLVSGAGAQDTISVTFRNLGKLPIRRLEFNCRRANARPGKAEHSHGYEPNVSFLPRTEYTLQYGYPDGKGPVLVSLKSVMFSDGNTWKPSKRDPCRTLKIVPPRAK
jgi:hypothetical protein